MEKGPVRWGIMSTANIARASFLPAVMEAGGAVSAVAGRDRDRTETYARHHGIDRALVGYRSLVEDPEIDAVYIALPNALHAEWTMAALEAGKAVLCEKPLCVSVAETKQVLEVARRTGSLLWEAFVFPFRHQSERLLQILESGEIGEVREVQSDFHFSIRDRDNIRLSPALAGGALNDVGCYCVRLGQLVFGADPEKGSAYARWAAEGVDEEMQVMLSYPGERRLLFSCGMARSYDTFTRVLCTEGEIRLTNAFHPTEQDSLEVIAGGESRLEHPSGTEKSFTPAIRHIQGALRGEAEPQHLARQDSLGTAIAMEIARQAAGEPPS